MKLRAVGGFTWIGIVLLLDCLAAADWPEFRGPTGQGIAEEVGLPVTWSATENIRWKADIPGSGWSSPSVVDGRVYLTAAVPAEESSPSDLSLRALCLDAATGETIWNNELFVEDAETAPNIHSKNSHASPTPIVSGDRIYVHFGHMGTACLTRSGQVLWRTQELSYPPVHGNGGSPALWRDRLIFSCDGREQPFVVALSADDGHELWRHNRDVEATKKFSFCTPLVIEANGRAQAIIPGSNVVSALDPASGEEIWRVRYEGYSVVPRPVFAHGLIYMSTGYDAPVVLAIRPDGSGDVSETHVAWRTDKGAPNTPSLLVVGNELYMVSDNGIASCLDAVTGNQHWQKRIGGGFSTSPVSADGKIYIQDEEGTTTVIAPGTAYQKLATNSLGERTLASFAIAERAIFLRTANRLYRIEAGTQ